MCLDHNIIALYCIPCQPFSYLSYWRILTQITTCIHTLVPPSNTTVTPVTVLPLLRGNDFQLKCSASGNHAPNFTWSFANTTNHTQLALSEMSNSRYSTDSARGQLLTVRTATYQDVGTYICTATNEVGNDTGSINIEIQGI